MLYYGMMFLTVGLIAGVLNFLGAPGVTIQVSWILYGIGMMLVGGSPVFETSQGSGYLIEAVVGKQPLLHTA